MATPYGCADEEQLAAGSTKPAPGRRRLSGVGRAGPSGVPSGDPLPEISLAPPTGSYHRWGKRILDVTVSAVALIFFLPFWLVIALAVRLDSPGPILYRSWRVGEGDASSASEVPLHGGRGRFHS